MSRFRRACSAMLLTLSVASAGHVAPQGSELRVITEPDQGLGPIYQLIRGAVHSVDLEIYELVDPQAESILAADAARGVKVEVILDRSYEQKRNQPAFTYLSDHKVSVRWAPARYDLTHEKALIIDGRQLVIMTLNMVAEDYSNTRDFAVVDAQRADVSAAQAVFDADWSDQAVTAPAGADLVWSPGSESTLVSLIGSARHSVAVENEEMSDAYVVRALVAAARRHVQVRLCMTYDTAWKSSFDELTDAGVQVRTYSESAPLYIHAKAIVVDGSRAFVGSENFSVASLLYNRELGLLTSSPSVVAPVLAIVDKDFAGARPWS